MTPERCETVREWIHERLDGPVSTERLDEIEAHLLECAECSEVDDGLRRVQAELRSLPEIPFPDARLETVWARTTGARRAPVRVFRPWGLAAAAAVLTAVLLLWLGRPKGSTPSNADIAQAERDARLALTVAAQALHTTESTAIQRVLATEVSPVLRRIPVRWPRPVESDPTRSRT